MTEQIDIDINVNMENLDEFDTLTAKLEEATAQVESLQDELASIELGDSSVDFDEISSALSDAETEAEALQSKLDEIDGTTLSLDVDSTSIDETNSKLDETNEKLQETDSSAASLTTALGGIVAMVGIDQMVTKADNVNSSYKRLSLTFQNTGVSVDDLIEKVGILQESTGRSGMQIRDYFNQMGRAGITNTDLLTASFESMSGQAFEANTSIESIEGAVQRMVLSGNAGANVLRRMGLSSTDLANAMGVTKEEVSSTFKELSETERLEVLNKAMGDGTEANEMYKNSFAGIKEQATIAFGGLMVAIGQGVLPVLTPVLQGATNLVKQFTNSFKSLPGPVQGAVGAFAGFLAVGATAVGTLGLLGKAGKGVVDGLKAMHSGYTTVKTIIDSVRGAESAMQAVRAVLAIVTGAETTAEGALTAAKSAAIGPTMGLSVATNSLLWPLLLIAGAVVGAIAVLWYLYNTNETVRNGINWLATSFQQVGEIMYNAIVGTVQWIIGALQNLWNYIMTLGGLLPEGVNITGNQIIDSILAVLMFINTLPFQLSMIFINMIGQVLGFGPNFAQNMIKGAVQGVTGFINNIVNLPNRVNTVLLAVVARVASWAVSIVQQGVQAATNFVNRVASIFSGIVGRINSALSGVVNAITAPFKQAYNTVKPIIDAIKSGIDAVTGWMGYEGYSGYGSYGVDDTLNSIISNSSTNSSSNNSMTVNNNFNGLIEESAAEYIIDTVNDRLRKEKLLRGI